MRYKLGGNFSSHLDAASLVARIYRAANEISGELEQVLESNAFNEFLNGNVVDFKVPVFDVPYYTKQVGAEILGDQNPVVHFCMSGGDLSPHPMFDPLFLKSQRETLRLNFPEAYVYVLEDCATPHVKPNLYFDPDIWCDGAVDKRSPVIDFIGKSDTGGRRYSRFFSPEYFARQVPFLSASHTNLFFTWLVRAKTDPDAEGNPMFHGHWYRSEYAVESDDALAHFISAGAGAGNLPNPFARFEINQRKARSSIETEKEALLAYIAVGDAPRRAK